jgi:hypothetical protein
VFCGATGLAARFVDEIGELVRDVDGALARIHRDQRHRDKDGDDADHDHQLDEREPAALHSPTPMSRSSTPNVMYR